MSGDDAVVSAPLERHSHVAEVVSVVDAIQDGMTVAIGGFINSGHPMAIIRELVRAGRRDLTVVGAASAGLEVDMLIAAGCVATVMTPYVGGEGIAAVGTSLPEVNPRLKLFRDPVNDELLLAVPAIEIDVSLLHAAFGDIYGNVRHNGTRYGDIAISAASERSFVSVERGITPETTRANPLATSIDGVEGIVRATFGAHPFAAEGFYRPDEEHLREYVMAASDWLKSGSRTALDAYLGRYVLTPKDHAEYLDVVGLRRILGLYEF